MEILEPFHLLLFNQTVEPGPKKATGMLKTLQDLFFFFTVDKKFIEQTTKSTNHDCFILKT